MQFTSTELTNDTPVLIQVQPMKMENFENIEYQLMNVEHDDQNTEYQLKEVIAESSTKNSKKSFTKLNTKAILYTPKEKE
ncbi:unnamed protein product [Rhizophagus irregularis]|nr:unnamed protein product [Rhizophagus irregularis]